VFRVFGVRPHRYTNGKFAQTRINIGGFAKNVMWNLTAWFLHSWVIQMPRGNCGNMRRRYEALERLLQPDES